MTWVWGSGFQLPGQEASCAGSWVFPRPLPTAQVTRRGSEGRLGLGAGRWQGPNGTTLTPASQLWARLTPALTLLGGDQVSMGQVQGRGGRVPSVKDLTWALAM